MLARSPDPPLGSDSPSQSTKARSDSLPQQETSDDVSGEAHHTTMSPISVTLSTSQQSVSNGNLASCEGTPERKRSSVENIPRVALRVRSNESIDRFNPRVIERTRNRSWSFGDTPHVMVPCGDSSKYLSKLHDLLCDALDTSRNRGMPSKQRELLTSPNQVQQSSGSRILRRGSMSSCDMGSQEGIVLKPTGIVLEGKSGILSTLSALGLQNAKLEGISCFGSNVLVLIEGRELPQDGGENVQRGQALLKIGRKLTDRRTHGR